MNWSRDNHFVRTFYARYALCTHFVRTLYALCMHFVHFAWRGLFTHFWRTLRTVPKFTHFVHCSHWHGARCIDTLFTHFLRIFYMARTVYALFTHFAHFTQFTRTLRTFYALYALQPVCALYALCALYTQHSLRNYNALFTHFLRTFQALCTLYPVYSHFTHFIRTFCALCALYRSLNTLCTVRTLTWRALYRRIFYALITHFLRTFCALCTLYPVYSHFSHFLRLFTQYSFLRTF